MCWIMALILRLNDKSMKKEEKESAISRFITIFFYTSVLIFIVKYIMDFQLEQIKEATQKDKELIYVMNQVNENVLILEKKEKGLMF